jgi:hyperosmotically inducible periplasmic protein
MARSIPTLSDPVPHAEREALCGKRVVANRTWESRQGGLMRNGQVIRMLATVGLALALTAGMARAADTPDSWITMKTQIALMTTEGVSTMHLNVDTVKGVVTLHGTVPNDTSKTKAEEVAKGIDGVKSVKNLLQVVPKSERSVVERSDDEIKKGVDEAFKNNAAVHDSGIKVASVNKGVVLLSGKTKSMAAHLQAIKLADAVHGVRRVATEVEVVPTT